MTQEEGRLKLMEISTDIQDLNKARIKKLNFISGAILATSLLSVASASALGLDVQNVTSAAMLINGANSLFYVKSLCNYLTRLSVGKEAYSDFSKDFDPNKDYLAVLKGINYKEEDETKVNKM